MNLHKLYTNIVSSTYIFRGYMILVIVPIKHVTILTTELLGMGTVNV